MGLEREGVWGTDGGREGGLLANANTSKRRSMEAYKS